MTCTLVLPRAWNASNCGSIRFIYRITSKSASLKRKILLTNQQSYLATMISTYQPPRNLRIPTMKKLAVVYLVGWSGWFCTAMYGLLLWGSALSTLFCLFHLTSLIQTPGVQESPWESLFMTAFDYWSTSWPFSAYDSLDSWSFEFLRTDGAKHTFV